MLVVHLPDGRQRRLARSAVQRAHAQAFLQARSPPSDPRNGQFCYMAGDREAAFIHHQGEQILVIEILQARRLGSLMARMIVVSDMKVLPIVAV